uniref:Uncharacterized protein n=1 Tax=Anguilla anguilla TaxID=7936 RepID=A0A0E9RHQ4_ANGAN
MSVGFRASPGPMWTRKRGQRSF